LIPGGSQHVLKSSLTQSRDTEGLFLRYDASIPFTDEERNTGINFLKSKGWTVGEPFICILVRDSKFMESYSAFDWSYHNYRNSDINSYLTSMEWLASQGVWVLRMGKLMSYPIATNSKRIIDYAFDSGKSDLLDIWLFANCNGVISTATGLDQLAMIYRRPQLYLNALPLGCLHSWSDMIWVPKNLRWQKTGKSLTITEYLEHEYYHSREYKDAGIEILDLSEDEIGAAVQEFWLKIKGTWQPTAQGLDLQESFWKTLENWSRFNEMHGTLHIKACVGQNWLTKFDKEMMI
jgi:putative glycosyltransferase (TIGR04372 family)